MEEARMEQTNAEEIKVEAPKPEEVKVEPIDLEMMDDVAMLKEIKRLKVETEELRKMLVERDERLNKMEKTNNAVTRKIADSLGQLTEQMDEVEASILEMVSEKHDDMLDEMRMTNDTMSERYNSVMSNFGEEFEGIKNAIVVLSQNDEEIKSSLQQMDASLQVKAEKQSVFNIHQRLGTMFAIIAVNAVGSIMILALLSYLIFSLAR